MTAGTPSVTGLDAGGRVPLTQLGGRAPPIDYAVSYCFGLRLLKVGYSGPLIRLRRASDDAESDFFSIRGFLDTAAIVKFLGGSDGFVTLYDQSGNGRDAVQILGAEQPQYVASHNGRPALSWDGIDDFLRNTGLDLAQPLEVSFVWQTDTQILRRYWFDSDDINKRCACLSEIDALAGHMSMFAGALIVSDDDVTDDDTHYSALQFDGATSIIRNDGVEVGTGDAGIENMNGITIGRRHTNVNHMNGRLYEFIVSAGGLLSAGQRAALEADQAAFYEVP